MTALSAAAGCLATLKSLGVKSVGIAPGSRSTALVVAAETLWEAPDICVHFDERGLGFWAVGVGKSSSVPAVVIVTSGTAVANLLPSVIEAFYAYTPMIIISADRPTELIDVGSNQAIRQTEFLKPYCRFSIDLHPAETEDGARHWMGATMEAMARIRTGPPGPVHLNMRFKEPLWNKAIPAEAPRISNLSFPTNRAVIFEPIEAGVVVVGEGASISDLPKSLVASGIPIVIDGLCGSVAAHHPLIETGDWWTSDLLSKISGPVVHIGGKLLSKPLNHALEGFHGKYTHATDYPERSDPTHRQKHWIIGSLKEIFSAIQPTGESGAFLKTHQSISNALMNSKSMFTQHWTEAGAMAIIQGYLSDRYAVFIGNSLAIRLWSMTRHFATARYRAMFNRGASGIDGLIATSAGIGMGSKRPVVTILGDLSALHDLNSFALGDSNSLQIIIIFNNDGGGIFRHLPIREYPDHDRLFRVAHGYGFLDIASQFNCHYRCAGNLNECHTTLSEVFLSDGGRWILEMRFDPEQTVRHINEIKNYIGSQL